MLITPEYRDLNRKLHQDNKSYGVSGVRYTDVVRPLSDWGRLSILDYGAGRCTLSQALGPAYRITDYDPCIEGLDAPPTPHDVVVCTDVMEHVEPDCVDSVLKHIRTLALQKAFFVISVVPAQKVLADGRNAHISLHPFPWWLDRIEAAGFTPLEKYDDAEDCNTFGLICR